MSRRSLPEIKKELDKTWDNVRLQRIRARDLQREYDLRLDEIENNDEKARKLREELKAFRSLGG